jgi:hypothetical protein
MKLGLLFFLASALAGAALHFDVTDGKGKRASGVTVEASDAGPDGWRRLKVRSRGKGSPVLVWPCDGLAKVPDPPGDIPVIVMDFGDAKALADPGIMAALVAGELLGAPHIDTGLDPAAFAKAAANLVTSGVTSEDPFEKGVGLLFAKKPVDAVDPLGRALKERERRLTRIPSEIYPVAILYGRALMESQKYDSAAVAFLKALKLRPSDPSVESLRAEALARAGKPEAK